MSYYKPYTSITEYKGVCGTSHTKQKIGLPDKTCLFQTGKHLASVITDYILFSLC
jgi:hypothetical protein